jgi:hypothetical protein
LSHDAPAENLKRATVKGRDAVFSLEPTDYMPLCGSCHRTYDHGKATSDRRVRELSNAAAAA